MVRPHVSRLPSLPAPLRLCVFAFLPSAAAAAPDLRPDGPAADPATVEISGLGAGAFEPAKREPSALHWVPDVRRPLIDPLPGKFRNIYAPSIVEAPDGWRVFYGAWDGVPTGNDRIYSVTTRDFLDFADRHTVIEHGPFQHVCNVHATRLADGSYTLVCTALLRESNLNKPVVFTSPDGTIWNGAKPPYVPAMKDLVSLTGHPGWDAADVNGMNVLLREGDAWRLYFGDYRNFGKIHRASGTDGRSFSYDGPVLEGRLAVNDVRRIGGVFLMGLHMNRDRIWYSVSPDSRAFPETRELFASLDDAEKYIVAVGWVTRGDRLLGVLYGAGANPNLAANRIFARWVQRRAVLVAADGTRIEALGARGPERQVFKIRDAGTFRIESFTEDGTARTGETGVMELAPGKAYRLTD